MNASLRISLMAALVDAVADLLKSADAAVESDDMQVAYAEMRLAAARVADRVRAILDMQSERARVRATEEGPDAHLDEMRKLAAVILNDEPWVTPEDVRRLAQVVQMLDAWIYDVGTLPKEWTDSVAKAEEQGHTDAAIAKRESES